MAACGIDFSTSNSMVALAEPGGVRNLLLDRAHHPPEVMPSLLFCSSDGQWSFGTQTIEHTLNENGRFIQSIKCYLPGRIFSGDRHCGRVVLGAGREPQDTCTAWLIRQLEGHAGPPPRRKVSAPTKPEHLQP